MLNGARRITIAGTYAYILCDRGLVVVNIANPLRAEGGIARSARPIWSIRKASPSSSATRLSWIAKG